MSRNDPDPSRIRAARRELAICGLLAVAAAVVVLLAGRNTFSSMMLFPAIFASIVSAVALLSLLTARGVLWKPRVALVALVIVLGIAGTFAHKRAFVRSLQLVERGAMEAIGGRAAPAIPFSTAFGLDAGRTSPLSLEGRVTLVNFWATWCSACVGELPEIEKFWKQHRDLGLDVIGVTRLYGDEADVETDHIREFLQQQQLTFPNLVGAEDSPAHRAYRVQSLPATVLIDREGVVVAYGAGVSGAERLMRQAREMLGDSG